MAFTESIDQIVSENRSGLLSCASSWERIRIADFARVQTGPPFKSMNFNREGRGLPLIRIRDVARGKTETYYDGEYDDSYLVEEGDLIIGMDGDFNHAIWPGPTALLNQRVSRLIFVDDGPLLKRFVFHLLGGYLQAINAATPSVTVKHLSSKTIAQIPLPCPPVEVQQRILHQIDRLHAALDLAERSLEAAREQMLKMRSALFETAVQTGQTRSIGELIDGVEAGRSFRCHGRPAADEEWGILKVSAMTWGKFDPAENKAVVDEAKIDQRWEVREGDLLISRANTSQYVGASVVVGACRPRLLLSDKSLRLRIALGVDRDWLLYALSAPSTRRQMSEVATGTSDSMRNLSQDKIRSLRVRVPALDEQVSLARLIGVQTEEVGSGTETAWSGLRRAWLLRQAIYRRAVSGDLTRLPAPTQECFSAAA